MNVLGESFPVEKNERRYTGRKMCPCGNVDIGPIVKNRQHKNTISFLGETVALRQSLVNVLF